MILAQHSPRDYVDAIQALLPPGAAWEWPDGGLGDVMLLGTAQELARVEAGTTDVLDTAVETHRPAASHWHLDEYRRVASEALAGVAETMPRRPFAVGAHVGDRCWSGAAPTTTSTVPLVQVDQLVGPLRVGAHVGDRCWGPRSRYVLRVRYYRSVVWPALLYSALAAFRQAHVFLWLEDITGIGGIYGPH